MQVAKQGQGLSGIAPGRATGNTVVPKQQVEGLTIQKG